MNPTADLPTTSANLSPRVLVLEDHDLQRDILIVALHRAGVSHVWGADNAATALALLRRSDEINIVISDLMMEGLDGVAFLTELSQLPQPPAVILASALETSIVDSVEQMGRGLGLYMAGQLPKPAPVELLATRLRQAMTRPNLAGDSLLTELTSLPDLQRGLAADEFVPHYQATVSARDQHCLGVELQACWQHPSQGLLTLAEFKPVLDHVGLDETLTWQVLAKACRDIQEWARHGLLVPLSMTLPNAALRNPQFPDQLHELVNASGLSAEMLTLAIPSAHSVLDKTTALQICARLRMKGFGLALDQFATGNMAFALLAQFPFDELRIERQLTPGKPGEKAELLLAALIELGAKLSMRTVVTGVDSAADLAVVQALAPTGMQGRFITAPLPADALLRWWRNQQSTSAQ